jgi:hypothetical protein
LTVKTRLVMGEVTTLTFASPKSESLRTTVPRGICKQFNLKEGDHLDWTIEPREAKLIIVVSPTKKAK